MSTQKPNPYIDPTDYYRQYNESLEAMKNKPEVVEFDRLCFELFEANPQGQQFMKIITDRYLIPALAASTAPNFGEQLMYTEGFKEAFRMLRTNIVSHQQRIHAEIKS